MATSQRSPRKDDETGVTVPAPTDDQRTGLEVAVGAPQVIEFKPSDTAKLTSPYGSTVTVPSELADQYRDAGYR